MRACKEKNEHANQLMKKKIKTELLYDGHNRRLKKRKKAHQRTFAFSFLVQPSGHHSSLSTFGFILTSLHLLFLFQLFFRNNWEKVKRRYEDEPKKERDAFTISSFWFHPRERFLLMKSKNSRSWRKALLRSHAHQTSLSWVYQRAIKGKRDARWTHERNVWKWA